MYMTRDLQQRQCSESQGLSLRFNNYRQRGRMGKGVVFTTTLIE